MSTSLSSNLSYSTIVKINTITSLCVTHLKAKIQEISYSLKKSFMEGYRFEMR